MVTFDEVARLALSLPETEEGTSYGNRSWSVRTGGTAKGKPKTGTFVWERPLSKRDRARFVESGEEPPPDEVLLAVRVDGLAEKEAVLAEQRDGVFTIPHFNGYSAVLVRLDQVAPAVLSELVVDAWRAMAPASVVSAYESEAAPG